MAALVAIGDSLEVSSGEVGETFDVFEMTPEDNDDDEETSTMSGASFSLKELFLIVNFCERSLDWSTGVLRGVGAESCSPLVPNLSLTGFLEGGDRSSMEVSKDRSLFLWFSCCAKTCMSFRMESLTNM